MMKGSYKQGVVVCLESHGVHERIAFFFGFACKRLLMLDEERLAVNILLDGSCTGVSGRANDGLFITQRRRSITTLCCFT